MHEWDDDQEDEQHLLEVAARLRQGSRRLAMTVYTIQHGRRTPDQVQDVLDRASRAIRRNQLVRLRQQRQLGIH